MKKEYTPIVITSIIALAVVIIVLVIVPSFSTNTSNTLTVQGTSTVKVLPDLASVYFNIQTNGTTSSEANDANNVIYNNLKSALIALGFNESQIGTEGMNIYPDIIYKNGQRISNGYIATHSIKIEFPASETDKISSVIDAGANAGAGISSIDFELSPSLENQYKAQALEEASKDAKTKADATAAGFGKKAGKFVSVTVDSFNYVPWIAYAGSGTVAEASSAKAAAVDLVPTQKDVTAMVSATYKLS